MESESEAGSDLGKKWVKRGGNVASSHTEKDFLSSHGCLWTHTEKGSADPVRRRSKRRKCRSEKCVKSHYPPFVFLFVMQKEITPFQIVTIVQERGMEKKEGGLPDAGTVKEGFSYNRKIQEGLKPKLKW